MSCIENMVSIIIPIYNREKYIEECLQSVFNQTYDKFEIIIVDDGSSDNSHKVCQEIAEKDSRVKLFAGEHGGVSAARNIALSKAEGEFVFFLDSDDVIHPRLLETLVLSMKENGAQIAATDVANVIEGNWGKVRNKLANCQNDVAETVKLENDMAIKSMLNLSSPLGCIGGVMISRSLIGKTQFRTDLHIGEDFYFVYENLVKGASAVFLKQRGYYARVHQDNSSWDWSYDGFWTRFYRRKLVWESEEKFGRKQNAKKQKGSAFGCFMLCAQKQNPYSVDARKMRQTLRKYKKDLYPALTAKRKLVYLACCYCPLSTKLVLILKGKFSKKQRTIQCD